MREREKRLKELLDLVFDSQVEAAAALGVSQPTINRWLGEIPGNFIKKYAGRLQEVGLNPGYIDDPGQSMKVDVDPIAAIEEEIKTLQDRAAAVERRIKSLTL